MVRLIWESTFPWILPRDGDRGKATPVHTGQPVENLQRFPKPTTNTDPSFPWPAPVLPGTGQDTALLGLRSYPLHSIGRPPVRKGRQSCREGGVSGRAMRSLERSGAAGFRQEPPRLLLVIHNSDAVESVNHWVQTRARVDNCLDRPEKPALRAGSSSWRGSSRLLR